MATPLAKRIEIVVAGMIEAQIAGVQVLRFGDIDRAGKTYVAVKCGQNSEEPAGSGIFNLSLEIMAHGQHTQDDIAALEAIFDNCYEFSNAVRVAASGSFVVPQGKAVDTDGASKSGDALDTENRYNFTIYAQTQEISDSVQ